MRIMLLVVAITMHVIVISSVVMKFRSIVAGTTSAVIKMILLIKYQAFII